MALQPINARIRITGFIYQNINLCSNLHTKYRRNCDEHENAIRGF